MYFTDEVEEVLYGVENGKKECFEEVKLLQKAASFPARIPKKYWLEVEDFWPFGLYECSKGEVLSKKQEVIERVLERLNQRRNVATPDIMYRLLHTLSLLGVRKDDKRICTPDNKMYSIAYSTWLIGDDTLEENFFNKNEAMIYASEVYRLLLEKLREVTS